MHQSIRAPAVSGQFYPADAGQLNEQIRSYLDQVTPDPARNAPLIKALIVPHAGYVYSGPIAASAYKALKQQADRIDRVVLLGPSHRVGFRGIAMCACDHYRTPLGDLAIDRQAYQSISSIPEVVELDQAHEFEHSLEVQCPFLQSVLGDFELVPLVVGECEIGPVVEVIEQLWGGNSTLFVISSDLSHYHSYSVAREQDQKTADAVLRLDPDAIHYDDACGRNPVKGLLQAAQKHSLIPELVDLRNSGDTAGSHDRVVGYGAFIFSKGHVQR